jgi:PAS domain S-box-containing protein
LFVGDGLDISKFQDMNFETVGSAEEAMARLEGTFYDAVVSERSMPNMDGVAFLKAARAQDPEIPFIFLIDGDDGAAIAEALKAGAEYSIKRRDGDIIFEDLYHRIRAAVNGRRELAAHMVLDERYWALLQSLPGIAFTSSTLVFAPNSISGDVEGISGYTGEEISSRDPGWDQIIHPNDLPCLMREVEIARSAFAHISETEYRIIRKDGEIRWVHELVQTICEAPGYPIKVEGVLYDVTARKRAEAALADSESRYRGLVDLLPLTVFELDMAGRITFANQKGLEFFGYSAEDIRQGLTIFDVIMADDLDEMMEGFRLALGGIFPTYELLMKRKNGSTFPALVYTAPITRNGHRSGLRGVIVDISERIEIEEALKARENFYHTIIEDQTDLICRFLPDGTITFVNDAYCHYYGKTREDLVGQTFMPLVYEEDREMVYHGISSLSQNSPLVSHVHRAIPHNGEIRWQRWSNRAIFGEGGELSEIQAVGQDITEEKRMDDELRRAHKQLMDIIDFLPDATFVIDENGRVIAWNRAIEEMAGVRKEEIVGKGGYIYAEPFYGFKRPVLIDQIFSDDDGLRGKYDYIKRKGNTIFGEVFVPSLYDGIGAHLFVTASPLFDDEGRIVGAIESIRDISEWRRAVEALRRAHDELEVRVAERTRELEAKNAEMERFTYTVSHDLRSPLVTIQGFLGFLKEDMRDWDEEKIDVDVEMIAEAVEKMDYLLKDTLRLSRIGRVANPPEDVPFGEIVRETMDQVSEMARSKGVEISVAEGWPVVHVDRLRISEVLVNLIENGIKYMGDQPDPEIEVGWRKDGHEVVFFVRDNGIGIDPDQQEKVFELFYKSDPESEGTGAGLAIVERIIEVHGGRIWVESVEGEGCTFCFTLPVTSD